MGVFFCVIYTVAKSNLYGYGGKLMTKEKLDLLLTNGAITQEEHDKMLKMVEPEEPNQEPKEPKEEVSNTAFDEDKLERLIQAKVDKITSKLGREKADLQKKLDTLKREKLSDEERKQFEISEKEKEIADRERALLEKENRLYAIKAIKAANLDDGSDRSLELVDFVMSDDVEVIDKRIKAFGELVKKYVKAEVDQTFKVNGREPGKGSKTSSGENPYAKETFNLTKQFELESSNPELAKQLQAAARK